MRPLIVAFATVLLAAPAFAQSEAELGLAQRSRAIARGTMSPFCPGKTLYDCPSPRAAEWRADIRDWLAEGATPVQIRARLQAREPQFDLDGARPSPLVIGGLLAVAALLMLAIGFVIWRRRDPDPPDPEPPLEPDPLDARLESELARTAPYT